MPFGESAGSFNVVDRGFAFTSPRRHYGLPCVCVRCQLELAGVLGQSGGLLGGRQPANPLPSQDFCEGKAAARDRETAD